MAKTKPMTRNQNHDDDASNIKRVKTHDNDGATCWSDITHEVLFLVMMQLGVVDFLSFGMVCKSWRLLAASNRNMFMASKPPMSIHILPRTYNNSCYLKDLEGREFKITVPGFGGGAFVGLTCGYLIFFTKTTSDFWLVNPITRHELHFSDFPINYALGTKDIKAILVFSPSITGLVFVVLRKGRREIWFSIAGKGGLNCVSCIVSIIDLCAFKGKIYTLSSDTHDPLRELRLDPHPKLMLLETKNFPSFYFFNPKFVSSGDNLIVMGRTPVDPRSLFQLDFGEMKWVAGEKTMGEYSFFSSNLKGGVVAVKRELWADPRLNYESDIATIDKTGKIWFDNMGMWYFPHECLNVDLINE